MAPQSRGRSRRPVGLCCWHLLLGVELSRPVAAVARCGPGDAGTKPLGDGIAVATGPGGEAQAQFLCGEDAAQAAARVALHKRNRMIDAEAVLRVAKELQAWMEREASDYEPPHFLYKGVPERECIRLLKSGGQYSRRATELGHKEEFADATADLLRALLRPNIDPSARDKLISLLREMLGKADKKRSKALEDGDLVALLEIFEMDDEAAAGQDIDANQLKKMYRKLSLEYHPDKNSEAAQHFQKVRDAYEILSDPVKTVLYDTGGLDLVRKYEQGSDSLERTDNMEKRIDVDLKDVYVGRQLSVSNSRRVVCRACRLYPKSQRCQNCKRCPGEMRQQQRWLNQHQYTVEQIEIPSDEKCSTRQSELPVTVERGMMSGDRITHQGFASEKPKQIPGDFIVTIHVVPHPLFERIGNDLAVTVPVSLYEALLGFERELVHLDGHIVSFGVPRGTVVRPGGGLEIAGEGMPLREDPASFGKLIVKFEIDFPSSMRSDAGAAMDAALRGMGLGPGPLRVEPQRGGKARRRNEL